MTKLQDFLNSPINEVCRLGRLPKAGDLFGVELECEGKAVDFDGTDAILKDWKPEHDGSLRAHHGSCCEWVFNGPVKYKQTVERVNKLFDYFEKRKSRLVCSNRTSLHVHFNMGDKNAYQLVNMFILFTILEDLMDRYCGDDRGGNLFCLSSRHAEEQVKWMSDACFKTFSLNIREDMRYCAFNIASLGKFGTVEFRGMRGLDNRNEVLAWISILNDFCEYACYKMKNPVQLIEDISMKSPSGFLKEVFSKENLDRLTKGIDDRDINSSIFEGLRLVQMLSYRIGTEFDQVRLRGRDFWASFKEDGEPVLDADPAVIKERARKMRNPPRFRIRPEDNPFAPPVPDIQNAAQVPAGLRELRDRAEQMRNPVQIMARWAQVVENGPVPKPINRHQQAQNDAIEIAMQPLRAPAALEDVFPPVAPNNGDDFDF